MKWADPLYLEAAEVDEGRFFGEFFGTSPSGVKWAGPAVQPYLLKACGKMPQPLLKAVPG